MGKGSDRKNTDATTRSQHRPKRKRETVNYLLFYFKLRFLLEGIAKSLNDRI